MPTGISFAYAYAFKIQANNLRLHQHTQHQHSQRPTVKFTGLKFIPNSYFNFCNLNNSKEDQIPATFLQEFNSLNKNRMKYFTCKSCARASLTKKASPWTELEEGSALQPAPRSWIEMGLLGCKGRACSSFGSRSSIGSFASSPEDSKSSFDLSMESVDEDETWERCVKCGRMWKARAKSQKDEGPGLSTLNRARLDLATVLEEC